jgi:hypothetical protein
MKFTQLKKFNISDRTAVVNLPEVGEGNHLVIKPSSSVNKPYFNALLAVGGKASRRKGGEDVITVDDIRKDRRVQARLFSKHVVVGGLIHDDEGNEMVINEENVLELLIALIKEAPLLFDRVREVADDETEFYDEDEVAPDAEDLAGK